MKNETRLPFLRTENIVIKELPSEILIYDLEKNKAFCLNETARLIMEQCDGIRSIDEAIINLNQKLKSKVGEEMVWMVVDQLKSANFIEKDYEIPVAITRVSRRKILHSAAALGIALPIITSLVAPTAAQAQSSCAGVEEDCLINAPINGCCPDLICVNIEGDINTCLGCIPANSPTNCSGNPGACCQGSTCVAVEPGFSQCLIVIE
jgi:hypothetical protein